MHTYTTKDFIRVHRIADEAERLIQAHLYAFIPPPSEGYHWHFLIGNDNINSKDTVVSCPSVPKTAESLVRHSLPLSSAAALGGGAGRSGTMADREQALLPPPLASSRAATATAAAVAPKPSRQQANKRPRVLQQQQTYSSLPPPSVPRPSFSSRQNASRTQQQLLRKQPPSLDLSLFSSSYEKWSTEELVRWASEKGWHSAAELFQEHEMDGEAMSALIFIGRDHIGVLRVVREVSVCMCMYA